MSVFAASMIAFGIVLVLLALMAIFMAILTRIFPSKGVSPVAVTVRIDPSLESAISQAVNSAFPGARVSHIRELPH
ncbi:MAG: hypothetical protein PHP66_00205 [Syntrophales bacterium]|jgi:hypothetical protein|nr:hypothetical protein [Syntrophales bacterium]